MPDNYSGTARVGFAEIDEWLGVDRFAAGRRPDLGMGSVPRVVHAGCGLWTGCHEERWRHFGFEI